MLLRWHRWIQPTSPDNGGISRQVRSRFLSHHRCRDPRTLPPLELACKQGLTPILWREIVSCATLSRARGGRSATSSGGRPPYRWQAGMLRAAKRSMQARLSAAGAVCTLLLVSWSAHAAVECPKPAQQLATDVSIKVQSAVSLLPQTPSPQLETKAETVTRDLFSKYPNAGNVVLAHSMISMYCQFIFSSSFTDAQKLDALYRVEEWITRISGITVPMNKAVGTTCSTDPGEVLRPVRAIFDAWARLDIIEYIRQWAPESIQRSKYYARKRPDIEIQRSADFKKYSSVRVEKINPKYCLATERRRGSSTPIRCGSCAWMAAQSPKRTLERAMSSSVRPRTVNG